jgi:hypothetical protein
MILTFSLFWVVIKNNILYVIRTGNVDGGGLFFPSAVNQLFIGLYFMEFCLTGLFFLVRDTRGKVACDVQGVIMAFVLVFTAFYQIWLRANFNGLYKYAPVRLEATARKRDKDYELERLIAEAEDNGATGEDSMDLDERKQNRTSQIETTGSQTNLNASASGAEMARKSDEFDNEKGPVRPALFPRHSSAGMRSPGNLLRVSTGASMRGQDIQKQQEKDREGAKHILARLNRPLNDKRLAELENRLSQVEHRVGNILVPRRKEIEAQMENDPISRIIMQHNDELEDLDAHERDMLLSIAFTHPVLRETRPSVWIPRDELGVSDDEVRRTRELSREVTIDNRGAYFNRRLKVQVDKPPPDMSEFALVMAEL